MLTQIRLTPALANAYPHFDVKSEVVSVYMFDLSGSNGLMSEQIYERRHEYGSILYEVSYQKGNEGC